MKIYKPGIANVLRPAKAQGAHDRRHIIVLNAIILVVGCTFIVLIGIIDRMTAQDASLYVLYALPIFFGAWYGGRSTGILLCLVSVIGWTMTDLSFTEWEAMLTIWNVGLRLSFFVGISVVISSLKSGLDREKMLASIDFLTELPNRRTFLVIANQERERAIRNKRPLTLAYIDLDDFKQINDRSGHDIGDLVLKEVGKILKSNIRGSDSVARIGGDEFVILFPDTGYESAQAVLQKIEDRMKERMLEKQWDITVSIGAATYGNWYPSVQQMVLKTDRLMYAAKASGKNRICHDLVDPHPSVQVNGRSAPRYKAM
jgi:diguanylate cyclase (GGDEF)-like protein